MKNLARKLEFTYEKTKDKSQMASMNRFRLFAKAKPRLKITNFLGGYDKEYYVNIFDYYSTSHMRESPNRYQVFYFLTNKNTSYDFFYKGKYQNQYRVPYHIAEEAMLEDLEKLEKEVKGTYSSNYEDSKSLTDKEILIKEFIESQRDWYAEGKGQKIVFYIRYYLSLCCTPLSRPIFSWRGGSNLSKSHRHPAV